MGEGGGQSTAASKRREANRLAAARFRTRKKDQVVDLEGRVAGLETENVALRGEVRSLRGQLGIKLDLPISVGISGGFVNMGLGATPGGDLGLGDESPRLGGSMSLASMGGFEDEDEFSTDTGGGSVSKKRRKIGGEGATTEEENVQLKEQLRGYQATLRVMQEEIGKLKGRSVPAPGNKGKAASFSLDPVLAENRIPGTYGNYRSSSSRTASGSSSRHYQHNPNEMVSTSPVEYNDDAMAAQGLASLHLPLPRPGYERGQSAAGNSHLSLPPLSPVLRIDSASPGKDYEGDVGRGGYPASGGYVGSTPGRPTSPLANERLSSPSQTGGQYSNTRDSGARTLHALQNAAFAIGMQLPGSGASSPVPTGGRESPLSRTRSWGLVGGATPSGLGIGSRPHSRAGSRGLDSPISAERSGANDEDESPEAAAYSQDYFGRYPASGASAAHGNSRLREERGFEKGEEDETPTAEGGSNVDINIDPEVTSSAIDPSLTSMQEEMQVDAKLEGGQ